ncbi:hypothetical protein [Haloarcula halophila]|uniref:hypothetical protein n=1 Tax=Halomicroarcula sp. GCM10025335 TaxID=3252668 RepID=UPI0036156C3A
MTTPIQNQAKDSNYSKPIGLFFDRMDWVENQDPEFCEKLSNGVTKHGSLIESFHNYLRGWPIEASWRPNLDCEYDPIPKEELVDTIVNVLEASELDEPAAVQQGKYSDLEEYVVSIVDNFEDDLDIPSASSLL